MKSAAQLVSISFSVVTLTLIAAALCVLLFTDFWLDRLSGFRRYAFVGILILYALYRGSRMYRSLKKENNDEE